MDPDPIGHKPEHPPGQSVWPIGFAIGIACILVGLVISWWVVAIGAAITFVFGFLWIMDLSGHPVGGSPDPAPEPAAPGPSGARHYLGRADDAHRLPEPGHPRARRSDRRSSSRSRRSSSAIDPALPQAVEEAGRPRAARPLSAQRVAHRHVQARPQQRPRMEPHGVHPLQQGRPRRDRASRSSPTAAPHLGCPVQPLGLVQQAQRKTINGSTPAPARRDDAHPRGLRL